MVAGKYRGVPYAIRKNGNSVAYCALGINCGTRYEGDSPCGIAHLTEHTLFKGTKTKSSTAINSCLEKSGGDLNAFTTKENIVLNTTVLKEDLGKAIRLILDLAFNASFPDEEVEIEKGVVLDEISSYKDSPADDIYDVFEEKLFAGSTLSRSILGTEESVRSITPDMLREFRRINFIPANMALTVVAPDDEEKVLKLVKKCLDSYVSDTLVEIPARLPADDIRECTAVHFDEKVKKDDNEANCVIGGFAPSMYEIEDRFATLLLCNMVGGPALGSILGNILREKHGWVYNVECSYTPYAGKGIVSIIFGCDKANVSKCNRVIRKELAKLCEKPISERRLASAKRQILGQNAIGMENGEALCLSMNKSMISFGKVATDESIRNLIMDISAEKILEMARRLFNPEALSKLEYI